MRLHVSGESCKITLEVDATTTVLDLKSMITERSNYKPDKQDLTFDGTYLEDYRLISYYTALVNESTIILISDDAWMQHRMESNTLNPQFEGLSAITQDTADPAVPVAGAGAVPVNHGSTPMINMPSDYKAAKKWIHCPSYNENLNWAVATKEFGKGGTLVSIAEHILLARNKKARKEISPSDVAKYVPKVVKYVLDSLPYGILRVNLARLAEQSTPPTQEEWTALAAAEAEVAEAEAEAETRFNVINNDFEKKKIINIVCPGSTEVEEAVVSNWYMLLHWYTVMRRADYTPTFGLPVAFL